MNVLLISLFALERNTSVSISNIGITNGLLAQGHKLTWVMPHWAQCETKFDSSKVRIIRIPGKDRKRHAGFFLNKFRSHIDLLDFTRPYLRQLKKTQVPNEYYDVVVSTSDPKSSHVFASRLLKRIHYGRWIQHWGDPLLGDITRNFWWPRWCVKLYEWNVLRKADKVVYVTPFTCNAQRTEYPKMAHKFVFTPLPADMCFTKTVSLPYQLRVAYVGDYNPVFRNLQPLYDACIKMQDVYLTIAGNGPKYPTHTNITILPRVPQKQALEIESDVDVIFCVCNMRGTQIPGKILYKASSDKHILIAVEHELHDEMCRYFESYNRFVVCDNTMESITTALQSLINRSHDYVTPDCLFPNNVVREILQ